MRKKYIIKALVTKIAISCFFTAIFIFVTYVAFDKTINRYASIINILAIKESGNTSERPTTSLDTATKRLINYPKYGDKYATMKIPEINLELPVYHGDSLKIMRYGVGHYAGSYFPGEGGSIIMAAHNNEGFFHEIDRLVKGSKITLETIYGTFTYEVDSYKVVKETDLDAFPIQDEKEMLIMYTCYPIRYGVVGRRTERYVVYSHRVGDDNA